jgi:hypothetical protein
LGARSCNGCDGFAKATGKALSSDFQDRSNQGWTPPRRDRAAVKRRNTQSLETTMRATAFCLTTVALVTLGTAPVQAQTLDGAVSDGAYVGEYACSACGDSGCNECGGQGGRGGRSGKLAARKAYASQFREMPQTCYQPHYGCYPAGSRWTHRYPAFHGYYYRRPYNYRNLFDYPWHAGMHEPTSLFSYHVPTEVDPTAPAEEIDLGPRPVTPPEVPGTDSGADKVQDELTSRRGSVRRTSRSVKITPVQASVLRSKS